MIRINQIKLKCDHTQAQLRKKAAGLLHISPQDIEELIILRRSIDARRKPEIFYNYAVEVRIKSEEKVLSNVLKHRAGREQIGKSDRVIYSFPESGEKMQPHRTVIVGAGPAGLFCAYFLALHGYKPILLERGRNVDLRSADVEEFWRTGVLKGNSNVQFGEGGAGAFSDGKLNTLVRDKDGRNRAVLETFVKFGAKESILFDAKPHMGTDVLCGVVKNMRKEILALGGEVRFESHMTELMLEESGSAAGIRRVCAVVINGQELLPCSQLVLAIGHSARDTFSMLHEKQIPMEAKSFAVGFRVEHPQKMINESQYGRAEPGILGAASYKLTAQAQNGRGVYSFCMCPGGYVVNASSEEGRLAVNGMSYSKRDGKNANSAIIVSVTPDDYGSAHPLAGIEFQRRLEEKAFCLGEGKIPAQRYGEFKACVEGQCGITSGGGSYEPECRGAYKWADVSSILPAECNRAFVEGMEAFGRQIKGFNRPDAVLLGVESRTSSPVRIHRETNMQSLVAGLYPCGEGAGYAGGITSAAMDGIRVAEAIAEEFTPFH